ncbi:MAG: GHKL domain-containing protein [Candidatus Marinimicrobia bacterium]|nr:GHKL domain-containing protein [Candidatus Neomarinimicrobiota bacterium]
MSVIEKLNKNRILMWRVVIVISTILISYFHFTTPPDEGHIHLILMQFYLIPILIGAVQFGVIGGFGTAIVISVIVAPHIIFQWIGGAQHHLLGYLQIAIYNAIGYLTGLKSQLEMKARNHLAATADQLTQTLTTLEKQSEEMAELEEQVSHSERLSVIGELMASLAHELRNPLASIRGSVDILKKELSEHEKRGEFFQILVNETERMSGVVENYLALARRSKGVEVEYDIIEIIRNTSLLLASRGRRDQIIIKCNLPEEPLVIMGDPNDLRQILVNLILNGIQAMDNPGAVSITAQIEDNAEKLCIINIEDEGTGILDEQFEKLFEPFFSTKEQGTGLGLSIVKRIVENREWQIRVENRKPTGSNFTLSIPLEINEPDQATQGSQTNV